MRRCIDTRNVYEETENALPRNETNNRKHQVEHARITNTNTCISVYVGECVEGSIEEAENEEKQHELFRIPFTYSPLLKNQTDLFTCINDKQ